MTVPPVIFSGSSHPALAQEIVALLGTVLGKLDVRIFPDEEISVKVHEQVFGHSVFVIQSLGSNPNIYLMELFIILDALKRAGAASITVVLPYYRYARQDRLDSPGVSITARLIADLLTLSGANHLITMDLHSEPIEGFFNISVQHLLSSTLLIPYCTSLHLEDPVIVAPDKGAIKIASSYAKMLKAPLALIDKERIDPSRVEMRLFVGDVNNKTVILVDDICSTAGTLVNAAEVCAKHGAKRIISVIGHGLFINQALDRIEKSVIEKVIVTNSLMLPERISAHPKIRVISIAPLIAEAIGQATISK